jgi:hypothetical protein
LLTQGLVTFDRETPKNDWGNSEIFYLDRHNVNCGSNEAVQGFKLIRPTSKLLSYKYVCKSKSPSISEKTYEDKTGANETAGNKKRSANYLDRHNVMCKNGYALQRFKLEREGNKIFYSFKCVQVSCDANLSLETTKTDNGGFNTIYLDRQDIRLKTNEVMVGFHLISKSGKFSYKVTYCNLKSPAPKIEKHEPLQPRQLGAIPPQVKQEEPSMVPELRAQKYKMPPQLGAIPPQVKQVRAQRIKMPPQLGLRESSRHTIKYGIKQAKKQSLIDYGRPEVHDIPGAINPELLKQREIPQEETYEMPKKLVKKHVENQTSVEYKGKMFCSMYCQPNPSEKIKKCYEDGQTYPCRSCILKATIFDNEKNKICKKLCDSIANKPCELYGYLNNNKKKIHQSILQKYDLSIYKR